MPILKLRRGVRGRACMRKRVRDDSQLAGERALACASSAKRSCSSSEVSWHMGPCFVVVCDHVICSVDRRDCRVRFRVECHKSVYTLTHTAARPAGWRPGRSGRTGRAAAARGSCVRVSARRGARAAAAGGRGVRLGARSFQLLFYMSASALSDRVNESSVSGYVVFDCVRRCRPTRDAFPDEIRFDSSNQEPFGHKGRFVGQSGGTPEVYTLLPPSHLRWGLGPWWRRWAWIGGVGCGRRRRRLHRHGGGGGGAGVHGISRRGWHQCARLPRARSSNVNGCVAWRRRRRRGQQPRQAKGDAECASHGHREGPMRIRRHVKGARGPCGVVRGECDQGDRLLGRRARDAEDEERRGEHYAG